MTVESSELRDPAQSSDVRGSLRSLKTYSGFLRQSASTSLYLQNADTVMGNLWLLINPILRIVVYYVIFILILDTSRGVDNTLGFITIGVFSYSFMRKVIMSGSRSISGRYSLIRTVRFPRYLVTVSTSVSELLAYAGPIVVIILVVLLTGETPSPLWLLLPFVVGMQFLWATGAAMIAARANYFVGDTENVLEFVFRMAFYGSGVLFLVERYTTNDVLLALVKINPLYEFIALYRAILLDMPVSPQIVLGAVLWTLVTLPLGYFYLRAASSRIGSAS